jgi:hypothetical protein
MIESTTTFTVQTTTQKVRLELQLKDDPQVKTETIRTKMKALIQILKKHAQRKDNLSELLFAWGLEFTNFVNQSDLNPSREEFQIRMDRIVKIFQDPFKAKLYKEPWIVKVKQGELVCDKKFLDKYRKFSVTDLEAEIHPFFQDITSWIGPIEVKPNLPLLIPRIDNTQLDHPSSAVAIKPKLHKLKHFETLISLYFIEIAQIKKIEATIEENRLLLLDNQQQKEQRRQESIANAKSTEEFTKYLKGEFQGLKNEYDSFRSTLELRLALEMDANDKNQILLSENVKKLEALAEQAKILAAQNWNMQCQLSQMSHNKGGGCTIL